MLQVTAKTAFLFILPQYNVSVPTAGKQSTSFCLSLALLTLEDCVTSFSCVHVWSFQVVSLSTQHPSSVYDTAASHSALTMALQVGLSGQHQKPGTRLFPLQSAGCPLDEYRVFVS